jgi:two-component system cell cycle sensor histidine kinase/response regulator CckA
VDHFVILIADDEKIVRSVVSAMLEGQGYTVLTAENGQQVVESVMTYSGDIHLVLCDAQMRLPSGEALRELIMRHRPATKVVLLSGTGIRADVPTFPKPFTVGQLRQLVREMLQVGLQFGWAGRSQV